MSAPTGSKIISNVAKTGRSRSRLKGKVNNIPSLKDFVHKQTVIRQYRDFLRAVGTISDDHWRRQCQEEVRKTFRLEMNDKDPLRVTMAVKEGERKLKDVRSMVGFQVKEEQSSDADSWLNIKDDIDPRGRVGTDWPWERKE